MLSLFALLAFAAAVEPAELTVEVGPLRNLKGYLGCRLFAGAEGFPTEGKTAVGQQRHKPAGNYVTCVFKDLKPGTYAVSVHHDEDADGELATNFLGMPQEGYGASNNKLPSLSAPVFEDSSFALTAGEKKKLAVQVKY